MVINRNYKKAVILTALRVEYEAVRAHLINLKEEVHPQGTIYEKGLFSSKNQSWEVSIAEIGAGSEGAAMEAERAIQHFNPDIIIFVGVAGGVKDVAIGDVVVATKVYAYESGKADEVFKPRPNLIQPKHYLIQRVKAEARRDNWLLHLGGSIPDPPPRVYVEPIAVGEKVVSSTRSAVYKFLTQNYNDSVAVEMEGYGFLTAAHANPQIDALVIRGISDLINNKEQTDRAGMQRIASRHAAAFAFEILTKLQSFKPITKNLKYLSFQLGYLIARMFLEGCLLVISDESTETKRMKNEANLIYLRIQDICRNLDLNGTEIYWQRINELITNPMNKPLKELAKEVSDTFKFASMSMENYLTNEKKAFYLLGKEIAKENNIFMGCLINKWKYKSNFSIPKDIKKYDEIYSLVLKLQQGFIDGDDEKVKKLIDNIHKNLENY